MKKSLLYFLVPLLLAACGQVEPNERAIFVRWGVIAQQCFGPTLYWYNLIGTDMDIINVGVQAYEKKKMGAATKDLQEIHADVVVNYSLDAESCHKMFLAGQAGHAYREKVLDPALNDALKAGTAHFAIAEIIQNREKLRIEVTKALQARVAPYYIRVPDNGVNLVNFDVSKKYMDSVEAKQIEEQRALQEFHKVSTAQRQAEIQAAVAKGIADAVREAAKGEADALRTKAAAQADYNQKVSASLTPILVQQRWIDAWEKGGANVPSVLVDGKAGMFLQLPVPAVKAKE